jgi:fimbrial isopeptide formation D2 family protein/LPXTG-motif cell wall-anchored protein
MSNLTRRMRGALAAVFAAVIAVAMTITPGTAFASQPVNLSGLETGDQVTMYQVVEYDENGHYAWTIDSTGLPDLNQSSFSDWTDEQIQLMYSRVTDAQKVGDTRTVASTDNGTLSYTLDRGLYIPKIINTGEASHVYKNTVIAVNEDSTTAQDVAMKEDTITPTKKGDKSSVKLGETVTYTITSTVPTYADNSTDRTYEIVDVLPAGLTFGSVTSVSGSTAGTLTADTDYTVTQSGQTITIDLSGIVADTSASETNTKKLAAGETITVTLTATRTDGNGEELVNQTYVNYSKDSYGETPGTTDKPEWPVYSFNVNLTKVDATTTTQTLSGASFTLSTTVDGATKYVQADGSLGDTAYTFTTDDSGNISFVGLADGTYTLTETAAPADHVLDSTPITVTIAGTYDSTTGKIQSWNLKAVKGSTTLTDATYTTSDTVTTVPLTGAMSVPNSSTGQLPSTGEAGTVALTVAGIGLVAVAAGLVVRNNKKSKEQ